MRIVGGRLKGRALAAPKGDGGAERLRPTTDRVREALFNILEHGEAGGVAGRRVLDLFAGTGALGLEALSRGATRALFVDDGAEARALLRRNIEALGLIGVSKVYRRDAVRLGPNRGEGYDLIFLDPPYHRGLGLKALDAAQAGGWLAPGAVIVHETASDETVEAPAGLEPFDDRLYGGSRITLLRR